MFRPVLLLLPYLAAASFSIGAPVLPGIWPEREAPPNVVVIMTDDLSMDLYTTLVDNGWMPNLKNHLLEKGIQFSNAFVTSPVCSASRASYLTGQYPHNTGVLADISPEPGKGGINWPGWLPGTDTPGNNRSTIATWLRNRNYVTGYIGRYLDGYGSISSSSDRTALDHIPPGWDDWQGLIDPFTYSMYDFYLNDNGMIVSFGSDPEDYQTDVLASRATDFIISTPQDERPFFLTIATLAPHPETPVPKLVRTLSENKYGMRYRSTIRPAPRHSHLIDGELQNGELPSLIKKPSFNEEDLSDKPSCPGPQPSYGIDISFDPFCTGDITQMSDGDEARLEKQFKTMAGSMLAVDELIGKVVDALAEAGHSDNTVIIFTSDSGWHYGEHRINGRERPYEEAIRVPLVIMDPRSGITGTAEQPVLNLDLAPTIADLAGVRPAHPTDGVSLRPLLDDPHYQGWHRKSFLIEHYFIPGLIKHLPPTTFAIRHLSETADFLFVSTHTGPELNTKPVAREFYDLVSDPFQMESLPMSNEMVKPLDEFLSSLRNGSGQAAHYLESF